MNIAEFGVGPFGPVRRKERTIEDRAEINAILTNVNVMRLALADSNQPFLIPLFFAYIGQSLYFHSSHSGTKIDIIKRNPNVCFEISTDHGIVESKQICDFEARHRTVIGFGKANFVDDPEEKVNALCGIVSTITKLSFEFPKARLQQTLVVRIDITSITGKKYGF
jgi:nitroimidazol reductase NimA-like FMN-containing flavoprotein (pyridoxamine 5'-phosphate oxidase superfamily)